MEICLANKAKKPLDAIYPLEWEERALTEVIQGFQSAWGKDREHFEKLSKENESIDLEEKNLPNLQSDSKKLIELYERIFHQLIFREPYLYRMLAYITIDEEDREARQSFFAKYLSRDILEDGYNILTFKNILEGSGLAQKLKVSSVALHACFVGKVLAYLFDEAESRRMTDTGNPEHFKIIKTSKGLTFEYFKKADYKSPLSDEIIDGVLYSMINKAQKDKRQNLFFGNGLDHREYKIIRRFDNEEKEIPFHLLPKYAGLIRKVAKKDQENNSSKESFQFQENKIVKIFLEAVLGESYKKEDTDLQKPLNVPFSAFITEHIKRRKGKEWEDESIQVHKKRISKEDLDHECGSLDDWINIGDKGAVRRSDSIEDTKTLDPESSLLCRERNSLEDKLEKYLFTTTDEDLKRLIQIHVQEGRRSEKDQKFYNRKWDNKIKEIREIFDIHC